MTSLMEAGKGVPEHRDRLHRKVSVTKGVYTFLQD